LFGDGNDDRKEEEEDNNDIPIKLILAVNERKDRTDTLIRNDNLLEHVNL